MNSQERLRVNSFIRAFYLETNRRVADAESLSEARLEVIAGCMTLSSHLLREQFPQASLDERIMIVANAFEALDAATTTITNKPTIEA